MITNTFYCRYDIFTGHQLRHEGQFSIKVHPDRIPIFQRGGSIIPKKERIRRSSTLMANDPITLVVALDADRKASGSLYIDDGKSFNYRRKQEFVLIEFDFANDKLTGHLKSKPGYECKSWLERVVILGWGSQAPPKSVKIVSPLGGEIDLTASVSSENKALTIRRPGVNICADWELNIVN